MTFYNIHTTATETAPRIDGRQNVTWANSQADLCALGWRIYEPSAVAHIRTSHWVDDGTRYTQIVDAVWTEAELAAQQAAAAEAQAKADEAARKAAEAAEDARVLALPSIAAIVAENVALSAKLTAAQAELAAMQAKQAAVEKDVADLKAASTKPVAEPVPK